MPQDGLEEVIQDYLNEEGCVITEADVRELSNVIRAYIGEQINKMYFLSSLEQQNVKDRLGLTTTQETANEQ